MNIRTIFFGIAAFVALGGSALAQLQITGSDVTRYEMVGGKIATDDIMTLPSTVFVGDSGATSQTYDFNTGMMFMPKSVTAYVDPATTPYAAQFAGASVAYADTQTTFGAGYSYLSIQPNGVFALGFGSAAGVQKYLPLGGLIYVQIPLFVGARWNGNAHIAVAQITVDGTCDATGTLKTSRGNFGCLRTKTIQTIGAPGPGPSTKTATISFNTRQGEIISVVLKDTLQLNSPNVTPLSISYRHPDGTVLGVADNDPPPNNFSMYAYPNPATTQSTLGYSLNARSAVTAELVNIVGERIATLATGVQEAGAHFAPFDVSSLSAGSYVLRLTINGKTSVEPVVVVK